MRTEGFVERGARLICIQRRFGATMGTRLIEDDLRLDRLAGQPVRIRGSRL